MYHYPHHCSAALRNNITLCMVTALLASCADNKASDGYTTLKGTRYSDEHHADVETIFESPASPNR